MHHYSSSKTIEATLHNTGSKLPSPKGKTIISPVAKHQAKAAQVAIAGTQTSNKLKLVSVEVNTALARGTPQTLRKECSQLEAAPANQILSMPPTTAMLLRVSTLSRVTAKSSLFRIWRLNPIVWSPASISARCIGESAARLSSWSSRWSNTNTLIWSKSISTGWCQTN